jgi:L-ribulose-5-phosphate 4-epimerase
MDILEKSIITAKDDFLIAAKRAFSSGLQTGTGGNISVRVSGSDLMVVKASGIAFDECIYDNIIVTDFEGKVIEGNLKPTQEFVLHASLYQKYRNIGAIVHTHSPYSIAWTFTKKELPLITQHSKLKLKQNILNFPFDSPTIPKEGMVEIYKEIDERPDLQAFLLEGHGIVAIGKSAVKACQIAELVEETAKIVYLNANLNKCL